MQQKLKELHTIQVQDPLTATETEASVKEALSDLLEQEDMKWRQRAKENWLKEGDRNTKFFHMCANQSTRRNQIVEIRDINGNPCNTQEAIEAAFS